MIHNSSDDIRITRQVLIDARAHLRDIALGTAHTPSDQQDAARLVTAIDLALRDGVSGDG
jgi:hypothetical protein